MTDDAYCCILTGKWLKGVARFSLARVRCFQAQLGKENIGKLRSWWFQLGLLGRNGLNPEGEA